MKIRNIVLLLSLSFLVCVSCNKKGEENGDEQQDSTEVADTTQAQNTDTDANQNDETRQDESAETEEPAEMVYYVIVGSFKNDENAKTLKSDLKEKGYPSKVLEPTEEKFNRVTYKSYETKEEARQALKEVRKNREDAWILTIEKE